MRGNLLYSLVILVAVPFGAVAGSLTDERVITTGTITAHQGGAPWSVTSTTITPVIVRDSGELKTIKRYAWSGDVEITDDADRIATTLFNPSTSTVTIMILDFNAYYKDIESGVFRPEFRRITAHSGGTLFNGAALGKNHTDSPNASAEIRVNNPTDMSTTEVTDANGGLLGMPIVDVSKNGLQWVDFEDHVGINIFLKPGEGLQYKWIEDPTVKARFHWVWEEVEN